MNGYQLLKNSYEQILKSEKELDSTEKEEIQNSIDALDVLCNKSKADIERIFDTGAFNDICKEYARKAMINYGLDQEMANDIVREIGWLFDTENASQICGTK